MKRLFLAACGAALVVCGSVSAREVTQRPPSVAGPMPTTISWVALAASPNQRVFQSAQSGTEEGARADARTECENATGRTCSINISVPVHWDVVVLSCNDGRMEEVFMGGSSQGYAREKALEKAQDSGYRARDCVEIASY
jgi:hypothetical protein